MSTVLTVPRYSVDLSKPPEDRWDEILTDKRAVQGAKLLCEELVEDFHSKMPAIAFAALKRAVSVVYSAVGTGDLDYSADMDVIAKYAIGDRHLVRLANLSYELFGVGQFFGSLLCTSVAVYVPGLGMVHARNMDWPIEGIKKHTILIDFKGPSGPFTAVTVPGLVGVLSGVAANRFSATINADMDDTVKFSPNFKGWAATFLLRYIFEYCETYEEAVDVLREAKSFVPFFVQLAGPRRGQACVVAVQPFKKNKIFKYKGTPLGVSNHFRGGKYRDSISTEINEKGKKETTETDSIERLESIERFAAQRKPKTLLGALSLLRRSPVSNGLTAQSMVLCSKTGEVLLNKV